MEMYIVLAITLFMMVMFIWNKVPFGVTTMTCCLLLAMFESSIFRHLADLETRLLY